MMYDSRSFLIFTTLMAYPFVEYFLRDGGGWIGAHPAYLIAYAIGSVVFLRICTRGRMNNVTRDLTGKTVVLTGGADGIGFYTACALAQMGASIHILTRPNPAKTDAAIERIRAVAAPGAKVTLNTIDLVDLVAVRNFIQRWSVEGKPIDILINNAATIHQMAKLSRFGDDEMLITNLMAPYILTEGLLPYIKLAKGRVVHVVSLAHVAVRAKPGVTKYLHGRGFWKPQDADKYDGLEQYGFTKLGLIYHTQQLAVDSYPKPKGVSTVAQLKKQQAKLHQEVSMERETEPMFVAVCVNPGGCYTGILKPYLNLVPAPLRPLAYLLILVLKTAKEGAQSVINASVREDIVNGGIYMECRYRPQGYSETACSVKEREKLLKWVKEKALNYLRVK
jgi:NAD(P)-dependent dehydrogenase (short-subunit alcohol dehydrogenase family)